MISGIVAIDKRQGIGLNGSMPWPLLKEDLKFFKEKTLNKIVLMGSKTWQSIGKPLPNRINVVISKNLQVSANFTYDDPIIAIEELKERFDGIDIFVIGGQQLFESVKDLIEIFYVTEIDADYNCDRHFDLSYLDQNFKESEEIKFVEAIGSTPSYLIKEYRK